MDVIVSIWPTLLLATVYLGITAAYNLAYRKQKQAIEELKEQYERIHTIDQEAIYQLRDINNELYESNQSLLTLFKEVDDQNTADAVRLAALQTEKWLKGA